MKRKPAKLVLESSEPHEDRDDHIVDTYTNGMTVTRPADSETPQAVRDALGEDAP